MRGERRIPGPSTLDPLTPISSPPTPDSATRPSRPRLRARHACPLAALVLLLTAPAAALSPQPEAYCFAVADSGDNLVFINKDGDGFVDMGPTGTGAMEAIAFNPGDGDLVNPSADRRLFAVNGDDFGFLDYNDAFDGDGNDSEFIQISADVGTCTLPGGTSVAINDIDGLQFDVTRYDASTGTYVLWATVRDGDGSAPDDILVQIDPNTGLVDTTPTPGFTGGATCVRISGPGIQVDVDDIAAKPSDGILYAVNNIGGGTDNLIIVDPVTGAGQIVSFFANTNPPPTNVTDMEGLSFGFDRVLYGTTGASGTSPNDFWAIDTPDGDTTLIAPFPALGDYEAVACLVDNLITGTVFFDVDQDGVFEPSDGDDGFTGARVVVYIDNNNNGLIDAGDSQLCENPVGGFNLACPVTDPEGFYLFPVGQGNFVVQVDTATLPAGHTLTTDNREEADFLTTDFGQVDPNNDFGFAMPPGSGDLDITKTSDAGGPVVQGQTVTYTITVTNNTGITHNGIEVSDVLPPGTAYVAQSTVASGPGEFYARDQFDAVSFTNNDGTVNWLAGWVENDPQAGGAGPAAGQVQVVGGALRLDDEPDTGGQPSAARAVNLTGVTTALLSFDFATTAGVDAADAVTVEVSSAGTGGPFTTLEVFTGIVGASTGSRVFDISGFISATTAVRFRVSTDYGAANEFFFADNVEIRAGATFRDRFDPPFTNPGSFQRQNGTLLWSTDWLEIGESDGPTSGDIQVLADPSFAGSGVLRIQDNDNGGEGVQRQANLAPYVNATLSFLFRRSSLDDANDWVTVEISSNGGASWTELDRFFGPGTDTAYRRRAYDIDAYVAANTRIRFLSSPSLGGGDQVYFDDVMIDVRAPRPITLDNVPGGANADLENGVPGNLVEPGDGFILASGASMTVTLRATVDNPLSPYRPSLLNTAVVTSTQSFLPEVARHLDPVVAGTVGDRVWLDLDGDGIQDVGEPGLVNVRVELRDGTCVPASTCPTTLTGADGRYLFPYLAPGSYTVFVDTTTLPNGGAGLVASPGTVNPAGPRVVTAGEIFLDLDFGYTNAAAGTAIVGDFVWNDIDRDGIQDPGEAGVGGVTVELVDLSTGMAVGAPVTTGADGRYLFTGVAPGEYEVRVTDTGGQLAGFSPTAGPQSEGSFISAPVSVAAGQTVDDVDFGFAPDGCLPRLDFSVDALGNPLVSGQVIDNEFAAWGVTVGFTANPTGTGPAMIFDSAVPTGFDDDLGSPNETCTPPGPGIGADGEVGQPGENCRPVGNLLIISEDGDSSDPDDSGDGGTLTFDFSFDVGVEAMEFLDAENASDSAELFDGLGMSIFFSNLSAPGDNAFELLAIDTAGARQIVVTFPASGAISAIDFCLGSIVDKVWLDANGDGLFDLLGPDGMAGTGDEERGIAGVTVSLLDAAGNVIATTLSDAQGNFRFDGLPDGAYTILITDTGGRLIGLGGTTTPAQNGQLGVTITDGEDVVGINFGYNAAGTVGDRIWSDADGDGVQDPGEPGIAGVTVDLVGPGPDGMLGTADDVVLATTTTAANGGYLFLGVAPGSYLTRVTDTGGVLAGYTQTGDPDESGTCATCDGQGTASLGLGDSDLTQDYGYRNAALADISGTVFEDLDRDGVEDGGEPGFAGVTLELLDGSGNVVGVTTTDAAGDYVFPDLPAGSYTVRITDDAGVLVGYTLTSGLDAIDVTLAAVDVTDVDFGYARDPVTGSIGDTVWLDADADGLQGPAEAGISGVTVRLFRDADNDGVFEPTVSVFAGRIDLDGDGDGDPDDDGVLAGIEIIDGALDLNGNGVIDAGDDGTFNGAGVIDGLLDLDGDLVAGEPVDDTGVLTGDDGAALAATVTDANGQYVFPALAAGTYFVDVDETTLPDSTADAVPDLTETTYPVGVDPSAAIALSEGEAFRDADFGYVPRAGSAVLGDRVWYDADSDGLQDPGEVGIAGVDVLIVGPSCTPSCTVTTGPGGLWLATGLAPGDYAVSFDASTLPAGYNTTPTNLGGDDTYNVTVAAGDLLTHLDFGFDGGAVGTIGDRVWLDKDGDGVREPLGDDGMPGTQDDETGIAGVTLNLVRDVNGNGVLDPGEPIVATTTTALGGLYQFTGLPLGDGGDGDATDADYLVDVTDVGGVLAGLNKTSGTAGMDDHSQADPYPVRFLDGPVSVSDLTADFGYAPSAGVGTIGNLVWHDLDGDGLVDAGEPGLQGVTVELWLDDGDGVFEPFSGEDNRLRVATTDVNGAYQFFGLPAASYFVRVTDAAGVLGGFVPTVGPSPGADDNSQAQPYRVTLGAGGSDFTADFGYEADATGPVLAIRGTVFEDQDNDGTLDLGETLVPGATLRLYRDLDGDGALDPGEPLIGATTSNGSGDYEFLNLPPGDYLVQVDESGTSVDGYLQTTQTGSGGLEPVTLTLTDSEDHDFGFWNAGIVTTPVTLASFAAIGDGGSVEFVWTTATEAGNLGFHLYVLEDDGLRRLNDELIPSAVGDSLAPQEYRFTATGVAGTSFLLEDLDLQGVPRYHGPFHLDAPRGAPATAAPRIDWPGLRRGRELRPRAPGAAPGLELAQARIAIPAGAPATVTDPVALASPDGRPAASGPGGPPRIGPPHRSFREARLLVDRSGIYRVTYEDLAAAGIVLHGAPAAQLALSSRGQPVPLRVVSRGDFGPGDYVEFVGEGLETLYTRTNVYSLRVVPGGGPRVSSDRAEPPAGAAVPDAYLETAKVERNLAYHFASPSGDPWFDTRLLAISAPVEASFALELEGRVPGAGPASLELSLWGVTDFGLSPDHHVVVAVNGVELASETFDGLREFPIAVELPESVLTDGGNRLTVSLPHDTGALYDLVHFDHYRVSYPRAFRARGGRLVFAARADAFRVAGLLGPEVRVYRVDDRGVSYLERARALPATDGYEAVFAGSPESATYHVATADSLLRPVIALPPSPVALEDGAPTDLVIVSHADFIDGLAPLVAARRAAGLSVRVVDVESLYERYSFGVFDPEAIRAYVRYAYQSLGTRYVLLVGGDTYDYHDYLGLGSISFVPSLYFQTDAIVRFAPVDPLFGDVDDDLVPDVAVGRLPVRTAADLAAVLQKTLEYDTTPDAGTALLVADAFDAAGGFSFGAASDDLASRLPADWDLGRAHVDELGIAGTRRLLLERLNAGVGLTSYFGHSGLSVWSFHGLFRTEDADALQNRGRPTVVTQWGCWNTYHVSPRYDTLAHRLLLGPDRGAAAVLGAATLTEALSERRLGERLFARLGRPGVRLGDALLEARRDLAGSEPDRLDVLLGWTLLGDPTLVLVP